MVVMIPAMRAWLAILLVLLASPGLAQQLPQPQVFTQPQNDNSTRAASTSYVDRAMNSILGGVAANTAAVVSEAARAQSVEATLSMQVGQRQLTFRFDPRSFGATCNGSGTGDDTGIASALNALKIAGGGALTIPGKCVISSPKAIAGVSFKLEGNGVGASQLIGSSSFGPSGAYLLSIDITAASDVTAEAANVGFRTAQSEVASALSITAAASGLEQAREEDWIE